jgi:hypothetical protein
VSYLFFERGESDPKIDRCTRKKLFLTDLVPLLLLCFVLFAILPTHSLTKIKRPTIPHCSMATLIGLSIKVKLMRSLPKRFKIHVAIEPGTHSSEDAVTKQLNDKERVAAALENTHLLGIVNKCIREGMSLH